MLRLLWRSRKDKAYLQRWHERFGFAKIDVRHQQGIWIHAVSMGESLIAIPLIQQLQARYPDLPITVTTMTVTGSERIRQTLSDRVHHLYIPYDLYWMQKRLITQLKPALLIIMETELWPNLLSSAKAMQVPIFLANGRLSEKSAQGYARIGLITQMMLSSITKMAVQEKAHAERFIQLGMKKSAIHITGSMKYDITISDSIKRESHIFRECFKDRAVWIAASTHDGEEVQILNAYQIVKKTVPSALLILVPRHPERFDKVTYLAQKKGYEVIHRSELKSIKNPLILQQEIIIGDTMGELLMLYGSSDVAFVGGSLVEHGGQNPLEPAALGLPIVMGPHLYNFSEITDKLKLAGALEIIPNEQALAKLVIEWLIAPDKACEIGQRGYNMIVKNRGALQKHLEIVETLLKQT